MDIKSTLGLKTPNPAAAEDSRDRHLLNINLKLAAVGQPICEQVDSGEFLSVTRDLVDSYLAQARLIPEYLCPADQRIQDFLDRYIRGLGLESVPRLPSTTLVLHRYGIARELSLPPHGDTFASDIVKSYRVRQGILHNTLRDRRTTEGSFHIADGGLPIPGDKQAVPGIAFARMLDAALNPPVELMRLPFTANEEVSAEIFVSLLIRPPVCPEVPGRWPQKSMEIRLFAPGGMVSNLDFVESIFGNAGNPYLPDNDAGLDVDHWTGHTGCVLLAPHILGMTKKALGLPHADRATPRQIADGMFWREPDEPYNDGRPFKITARDASGVIVTLLTDNYFGYCKKEVKTQIGFAANLFGLAEEEHAGGALTFPRHNHGEEFGADNRNRKTHHSFAEVTALFGDLMEVKPEGYGIDKRFPALVYVPENTQFDLNRQLLSWQRDGLTHTLKLQPRFTYMLPSGYKLNMEKHPSAPSWRLVGTDAEGVFCHKPCTVSGGGKSEISKSIGNAVLFGPMFVNDLHADLDQVRAIFERDYRDRFLPGLALNEEEQLDLPLLSLDRSLGSVIRVLTASANRYTPDYNAWLDSIPNRIKSMVFMIKRFYKPEWGTDWRRHFSVDFINGSPGNELKLDDRPLVASYLRVGFEPDGAWRVFKLRQDYIPAAKVQMEDDITVAVVTPIRHLRYPPALPNPCVKLTLNCEYRLFQRPDDAVHRGLDAQAERDLAEPGNFLSNFEPLGIAQVRGLVEDVIGFDRYSGPMRDFLRLATAAGQGYAVSSAHPRLVGGRPSQNPRYLQLRPDLADEFPSHVAVMGARLQRRVPAHEPVVSPVTAVLAGRRNNPPDPKSGLRPLCVYNPIHYQELPELFMDFICSVTGKSPSTTGAGSEGALTKGPFNALRATADLNNALVSMILTGYGGFSSAAGHVGPGMRIDHDISLLVPEIWSRLPPALHDPAALMAEGFLDRVEDFDYQGRTVLASRLGYRINSHFVHRFCGAIFDASTTVLAEAMLKPETQDLACFVDGVDNIVEAQRRVALAYLHDRSIEDACPPLEALLWIMATGDYRGMDIHHPGIRRLFTREHLLASDWYRQRLAVKQVRDMDLCQRHIRYLRHFMEQPGHRHYVRKLRLQERLDRALRQLAEVSDPQYLETLTGTIGADPMSRVPCGPAGSPLQRVAASGRVRSWMNLPALGLRT